MLMKASLLSLALPAAYGAVHEKLAAIPHGWAASELNVADHQAMRLSVAVNYQNLDSLESRLMEVADPESAKYGEWMEKEDVDALFAPSADSVQKVKDWVSSAGATEVEYAEGIVSFKTTVGDANKLLNTKFSLFTDGQQHKLRTTEYSIPDELQDVIDLVEPTTYFGGMKHHAALPPTEAEVYERLTELERRATEAIPGKLNPKCLMNYYFDVGGKKTLFRLIGPQCLKELYSVGDYKPDLSSGSTVAFGNFLNQTPSHSDLAQFEKLYNIPPQQFTVTALINGGVNDQDPATESDGEANLDVQNIIGLVGGLPVTTYITGGSPPFRPDLLEPNASTNSNEPYLPYYQYLLSQPNSALPYVITNSYGDHENTVPPNYAKRVCNMIGMMGMRGRTILESSGDEGVGAVCLSNTGKKHPEFTPTFPGTCPYVTAVGGTQNYNPEHAWDASQGGFSFYFPQPAYQKAAVNTYLTKHISAKTKNYYSSNDYVDFSGRGFPDISAHSLTPWYLTVINGTALPNGGTSAASPTTAGIFALLNDALFRAGKKQLGFVNPLLYSKRVSYTGLNDIILGGSTGCQGVDLQSGQPVPGAGIIPYASWNATPGWDPVTGLGTPNFNALKVLLA